MKISTSELQAFALKKRRVLVLVGPTASGKTIISMYIARKLNAEIISADSRQVYRFMDIGTAKPSSDFRKEVKHYFIDELNPDEDFNAGIFGKKGREIINNIFDRNKVPLVVGGSGLYIKALIDGLFEAPSVDKNIRRQLSERLEKEGAEKLLEELRQIDPVAARGMLPTNTRRIVRALEIYYLTGVPISQLRNNKIRIDFTPFIAGLEWDRKVLYERINLRTEKMISDGLVTEVKNLLDSGYSKELNSLQTVGYKEVIDYLDNKISYDRMIALVKQNSRRYAKRQLTWFRKDNRIKWFKIKSEDDFNIVSEEICNYFYSTEVESSF